MVLELRHLTKRYGPVLAVDHVSLTVGAGEILGYLGPNGSGKSSTVKMIVGLIPPTEGAVLFDGEDIRGRLLEYKTQVGYVPEEAHVYTHLTGPEYLRLCGRLRGSAPAALEKKIDIFMSAFGLDEEYHATLASYSKGMRQKVLLAAALLHNPRVLVLDEPTSGLDVSTMLVMRAVINALAEDGRIVFYSSHELDTVERVSSRVVIIRDGRVVADDSPSRLRNLLQVPSLEDAFSRLTELHSVERISSSILDAVRS